MKTSEILNLAADQIEQRGWMVGGDGWNNNDGSPLCLEGALMASMGMTFEILGDPHIEFRTCPAYVAVREYLDLPKVRNHYAGEGPELWRWNDRGDNDKGRVVGVLRAAALLEASKEEALTLEGVGA